MVRMMNLSANEVRVLGALIEKEITTPEYYPLSLNALVNACNQKNNREPVMALGEADVRTALFALEGMGLVRVLNDSRATKFEHMAYHRMDLRRPEIAVVGLLLLRGAQTAAELRARAERMYAFEETAAVTAVLERLAGREEALVVMLARQPGSRESRWMHLLGGAVDVGEAEVEGAGAGRASSRLEELERAVAELAERVRVLEER
jgi:uncharacterized protein YceH (UPF0502 family)